MTSLSVGTIVFSEVQDGSFEPTEEDVEEYARRLGINLEKESHLLYLAREGLKEKLPEPWIPCLEQARNLWFYYNTETQESQWEHPMDFLYRDKVVQARSTSAADLALNRIQNFDPLAMRPPKSLPPIRKAGASRTSMNSAVGSNLGRLGSFGPAVSGGSIDLSDPPSITPSSQNSEFRSQANNNNPVGRVNKANSKNIIASSPLTSLKDVTIDEDESLSSQQARPPKKSGLMLTGGGASFMKGSERAFKSRLVDETPAPTLAPKKEVQKEISESDSGGAGDTEKKPIKSILVNSISRSRPTNPSDNVYELDAFAMNLDEMTEEEKVMFSQLDSTTNSRSKGNVKFNLDENTELKFELSGDENDDFEPVEDVVNDPYIDDDAVPEDDEEESVKNVTHSLSREDISQSQRSPLSVGIRKLASQVSQAEEVPFSVDNSEKSNISQPTAYSNKEMTSLKQAMRNDIEEELQKFRHQLEEERRKKQAEIEVHFEMTVSQFKREKEENLRRLGEEMENDRKVEVDKVKSEFDTVLRNEIDELKISFDEQLETKKRELEDEHQKVRQNTNKIEQLTLEYRVKEEAKISEILGARNFEMQEEAESELKKQKETLREEHKRQILQLKDYHKTIIDKIKAELLEEEENIRREHQGKQAEIIAKFEEETENLKKQLVRTQEEALTKIQEEFEEKRGALEKSLSLSLQNVKDRMLQTQNSALRINNSQVQSEEELKVMKLKYEQLEEKYLAMKLDMEKQHTRDTSVSRKTSPAKSDRRARSLDKSDNRTKSRKSGGNSSFEISDTNQDSAHGSATNSDNHSSPDPSSDGNGKQNVTLSSKKTSQSKSKADSALSVSNTTSQSNRINAALQALEALKLEILELKQTKTPRSKPVSPEMKKDHRKHSSKISSKHDQSGYSSSRKKSSKPDPSALSPPTHDTFSEVPVQLSRSVSFPVADSSGGSQSDPVSEGTRQKIVEEAKAFIRMQKHKSQDPTVIPNWSRSIVTSTRKHTLDNKLLESIGLALAESVPADLNVSETESSGISSLKDHRSMESKKLSKEIDDICNSLNSLDKQMKLMWSVVKGKQSSQPHKDMSSSTSPLAFLSATTSTDFTSSLMPNTLPTSLGKSRKLVSSTSMPNTARTFLSPSYQSPHQNGAARHAPSSGALGGKNFSSLLSNSNIADSSSSQIVLDSLRLSGLSPTRLDCSDLLKSLEDELKEFKATKQRLMDFQNKGHEQHPQRSKVSASVPATARKHFAPSSQIPHLPPTTAITIDHELNRPAYSTAVGATSNGSKTMSSMLSNSKSSSSQIVLEALRMSGLSPKRLDCSDLLKSLEEELKEFKSTKQRLSKITQQQQHNSRMVKMDKKDYSLF